MRVTRVYRAIAEGASQLGEYGTRRQRGASQRLRVLAGVNKMADVFVFANVLKGGKRNV